MTDVNDYSEDEDRNGNNLVYTFRHTLPAMMPSKTNFSFWRFFDQYIGKELSKITMPLIFNEPISFLQRLAEYMEYSELINEAIAEIDPVKRMEKVSAFAVSVVSSNWDRVGKPFNPLLGETYELHTPNFKWISEQVSHHPPISAFCAESQLFKFYGSIHPKLKFSGKSVEITPKGNVTLELKRLGETYTWQNVMCTVHNIIIGKVWIEHSGAMKILNKSSDLISEINFHSVGWFKRNIHRVEGEVYRSQSKSKRVERKLFGKWNEALYSVDPQIWIEKMGDMKRSNNNDSINEGKNADLNGDENSSLDNAPCDFQIPDTVLIWKANMKPSHNNQYYNFTHFTMGLNQTNLFMMSVLAPTDSRFRKDIRCMEKGLISEASDAKSYLEEKQRVKLATSKSLFKKHVAQGQPQSSPTSHNGTNEKTPTHTPLWFVEKVNPCTNNIEWLYKGGYWDRDWSHCPEIF